MLPSLLYYNLLMLLRHLLKIYQFFSFIHIISSTLFNNKLTTKQAFNRINPLSDIIKTTKFHHLEFYTNDATNLYNRFVIGLGLKLISKSDQSTGNMFYASYVLQSNDMNMIFTAPYLTNNHTTSATTNYLPFPHYCKQHANEFITTHGIGVKCICITVTDLTSTYNTMINNGGISKLAPYTVNDIYGHGTASYAEIYLYGDVHLRLVETHEYKGAFLPNYQAVTLPSSRYLPFNVIHDLPLYNAPDADKQATTDYGIQR